MRPLCKRFLNLRIFFRETENVRFSQTIFRVFFLPRSVYQGPIFPPDILLDALKKGCIGFEEPLKAQTIAQCFRDHDAKMIFK